ncbi:Protein CBG01748 [Caenorhabditis briggsae]|uniref:Protein CBG01748 n=1 Tax=Caenorhabditis briggsae TaxID=6238 RepID=A8WQX9_CAEBR|nr:Protein CBG01748 [Caenorhabditis briggsae]CAP22887.2 Protein CBG01748 [Caenorhabditis briggsae]
MDSNTTTPSYQRKITNEEHKFNSENYMNSDQWQCGAGNTEKITKYFNFCWDKLAEMNMCCSIHDDCYGLARGRKKCDQSFFDCLKKSLEFKSSGMLCSGIWTNTAKASICFAGVMFYGESTTFSSCAYNHMICYMRLLPDRNPRNYEDCVDNLIVCLDESSEHLASENEECLTHVEITMKSISENSKISGIPTTREAVGPKHASGSSYSSQ